MIGSKKEIIQLWGREFDLVKRGLSQDQVVAFVTELVNQNNALTKKTERLTFMESLAEKTIVEADKLAASIRNKAREEATNILQAAEKEAAQIKINAEKETSKAREEATNILQAAEKEAAQIKINAEQEAKQQFVKSRERLKEEIREKVEGIYQRLLSQVEETVAEVWAAEAVPELSETPVRKHDFIPQPSEKLNEPAAEKTIPPSYQGKVDLEILPPVDLAQFMELRRELQSVPDLKITQVTSSLKNGCRISSLLIKPAPLLNVLRAMPEVREAVAEADSQQVDNGRRILITLAPAEQT